MMLPLNSEISEIVGIILGDGCMNSYSSSKNRKYKQHRLMVSLHEDESEYLEYVKNLMIKWFGIEPHIYNPRDIKVTNLVYYRKEIIDALISIGLKRGNKVKNQVGVPEWIKTKKNFMISCIRGLTDTDGSIYFNNRDKRVEVSFESHSYGLVNDYLKMCNYNGIKPRCYDNQVFITSKKDVNKFLSIVNPFKWFIKIKKNPEIVNYLHYKNEGGYKYYIIDDMKKIAIEKGGECLSDKYGNEKLLWECEFGHLWKAYSETIIRGSWCPECDREMRKVNLAIYAKNQKRKFDPSKDELQELVWKKTLTQIADENNVSITTIRKRCKEHNIRKPPIGYWLKS